MSVSTINITGVNATFQQASNHESKSENFFLLLCSCLVFCLQIGLVLLRVEPAKQSSLYSSNPSKIALNFFVSTLFFYYVGYMFSYGQPSNEFIGYGNEILLRQTNSFTTNLNDLETCFFRIMMASTTFVIALTVIGEKCNTISLVLPNIFMTSFVYPITYHWCWSETGWLKSGAGTGLSYEDPAGAAVIHITGATTALVANYFYTVDEIQMPVDYSIKPKVNELLQGVGYLMSTVGFLGLNCGGTLVNSEGNQSMMLVALNTILSSAVCGIIIYLALPILDRKQKHSYRRTLKGGLCGMIAAAAGANNIYPWYCLIIGITAAICFLFIRGICRFFHLTDPHSVAAVHLGGGIAGIIITPVLSVQNKKLENISTNEESSAIMATLWNSLGGTVIIAWTGVLSVLCFWLCAKLRNHRFFISKERLSLMDARQLDTSELPPQSDNPEGISNGEDKPDNIWNEKVSVDSEITNEQGEDDKFHKKRVLSWIFEKLVTSQQNISQHESTMLNRNAKNYSSNFIPKPESTPVINPYSSQIHKQCSKLARGGTCSKMLKKPMPENFDISNRSSVFVEKGSSNEFSNNNEMRKQRNHSVSYKTAVPEDDFDEVSFEKSRKLRKQFPFPKSAPNMKDLLQDSLIDQNKEKLCIGRQKLEFASNTTSSSFDTIEDLSCDSRVRF